MASLATVFGGSGFIGRYIVRRLARKGWRVRVAVRHPNQAIFVRPYGVPGQVEPVLANVRDDASIARAVEGADAVVNAVGILVETPKQKFDRVHAEAPGRIAELAAEAGATRLVHISSIGADPESDSAYARSKGLGEREVQRAFPKSVLLRPSIVFGAEDQFFNRFAALARFLPVIPVVCGNTRFQPVYVDNVAEATAVAVEDSEISGIHELGGPEIETFANLMQRMLGVIRRRRLIMQIPLPFARMKAGAWDALQFLSGGLFINRLLTRDQIRQLERDNVVGEKVRTLADLGITPVALDSVLESYLYRFRPAGQYTRIHESAEILGRADHRG